MCFLTIPEECKCIQRAVARRSAVAGNWDEAPGAGLASDLGFNRFHRRFLGCMSRLVRLLGMLRPCS